MKRFLHALAALWPKKRDIGSPLVPPTSTGLRQHMAAVLRIEGYLSECTDIHSRKRHAVSSDTHPARREVERPGSTVNRPERSDVLHPSRKAGSQTVGITERNAVTSRQVKRSGSPNQQFVESPNQQLVESPNKPNNHPRIPQPMPLLTILMLVFFMCLMAAPSRVFGSAAFLDSIPESAIRPLKIGDTIPEELWHLPLQVVNHPEGKETITLNDYRDKKLIILDFWATWCGLCVSDMPRMHAIYQQFQDDIVILPVTHQQNGDITPFLGTNQILKNLPEFYSVVDDYALAMLFPAEGLPNLGIIDEYGQVKANVRPWYLDDNEVNNLLEDRAISLPLTRGYKDVRGRHLLKFKFNDLKLHKPLYYSMITGVLEGLNVPLIDESDSISGTRRLLLTKQHLLSLYEYALKSGDKFIEFENFPNRRIVEVDDPAAIFTDLRLSDIEMGFRKNYEQAHYYTYELVAPIHLGDSAIKKKILFDLNTFFGLNGSIQKREMDCLLLVKHPGTTMHSLKNEHSTTLVESIVKGLNNKSFGLPPVLDDVGELEWVKVPLSAELNGIGEINEMLKGYGLELTRAKRKIEMFVISNPNATSDANAKLKLTRYGYQPTYP